MTQSPIAGDVAKPGNILAHLTPQLTFDDIIFIQQAASRATSSSPRSRARTCGSMPALWHNSRADLRTDPVEVGQRDHRRTIRSEYRHLTNGASGTYLHLATVSGERRTCKPTLRGSCGWHSLRTHAQTDTTLTLSLLVPRIAANHVDHATTADNFALIANPLDAGSNFHRLTSVAASMGTRETSEYRRDRALASRPPRRSERNFLDRRPLSALLAENSGSVAMIHPLCRWPAAAQTTVSRPKLAAQTASSFISAGVGATVNARGPRP